jgi:hypothetical protein
LQLTGWNPFFSPISLSHLSLSIPTSRACNRPSSIWLGVASLRSRVSSPNVSAKDTTATQMYHSLSWTLTVTLNIRLLSLAFFSNSRCHFRDLLPKANKEGIVGVELNPQGSFQGQNGPFLWWIQVGWPCKTNWIIVSSGAGDGNRTYRQFTKSR